MKEENTEENNKLRYENKRMVVLIAQQKIIKTTKMIYKEITFNMLAQHKEIPMKPLENSAPTLRTQLVTIVLGRIFVILFPGTQLYHIW